MSIQKIRGSDKAKVADREEWITILCQDIEELKEKIALMTPSATLREMLEEAAKRLHENAMNSRERLKFISYYQEKTAALLISCLGDEPQRSTLFLSASRLAVDLGRHDEAQQLIEVGLETAVPEIAEELRGLLRGIEKKEAV